ncbi:chitin synthase-domain-containing protein [Syncephalis fuscata]|nr:chitin synthase-domain-containing protein [Syncephalis fuscata]
MARRHRSSAVENDDSNLVQLPANSVTPTTVAQLLKNQHAKEQPYTDCGTTTLVSVNPGRALSLMQDESAKAYAKEYKDINSADTPSLPPHVFALASKAYLHLRRLGQDQAVVLTGTAGSGKTESHKALVRQLCLLAAHSKKDAKMHVQIQQAQHVLEAFGNTRSVNNPNASRYGLFEELQFNERGRVVGAKFLTFGFEKTRVVATNSQERSFHAFYYLLAGASSEERQRWQLRDITSYAYLRGRATQIPGVDDTLKYQEVTEAMRVCGIKSRARDQIFQLLSAILHLGELEFDEGELPDDACTIRNHDQLEVVATLLGVTTAALETALTHQTKQVRGDVCTVLLNPESARQHRDGFACALYSLLFTWLVECLNQKLCHEEETVNIVALLDPQGFRTSSDSSNNSKGAATADFEAFLTNFAAERVQAYASRRAFEGPVDAEMRADGIPTSRAPYSDNSACIELLRGSDADKKKCILAILDSEISKKDNINSEGLASKLNQKLSNHPNFSLGSAKNNTWTISHFAGKVNYADPYTLEKHADILVPDLVSICRASKLPFVAELFSTIAIATESDPRDDKAIVAARPQGKLMRSPSRRFKRDATRLKASSANGDEHSLSDSHNGQAPSSPTFSSVNSKNGIARQLDNTMSEFFITLDECRIWFAYHVQPNSQDIAGNASGAAPKIDVKHVQAQVQALSLPELVRQRHAVPDMTIGFGHEEFLERYAPIIRSLQLNASRPPREKINALAMLNHWGDNDIRTGNRRVFLSEPIWRQLENSLKQHEKGERGKDQSTKADSIKDSSAGNSAVDEHQAHRNRQSAAYSSTSTGFNPHAVNTPGDETNSILSEDGYFEMRNHGAFVPTIRGNGSNSARGSTIGGGSVHGGRNSRYDDDSASAYESIYHGGANNSGTRSESGRNDHLRQMWGDDPVNNMGKMNDSEQIDEKNHEEEEEEEEEVSRQRRCWVCCTWGLTWWIPTCCISSCGRMKREDIQMAWREKSYVFSTEEVGYHQGPDDLFMSIYGVVYDVSIFARNGHGSVQRKASKDDMLQFGGQDVTPLFPLPLTEACPGLVSKTYVEVKDNRTLTMNAFVHRSGDDPRVDVTSDLHQQNWYKNHVLTTLKRSRKGEVAFETKQVADEARINNRRWCIIDQNVIDLTYYYDTLADPSAAALNLTEFTYFTKAIDPLFTEYNGQDNTKRFQQLNPPVFRKMVRNCMMNAFKVGVVDQRHSIRCQLADYLLLTTACLIVAVIFVKFLAALQLGTRRNPEDHDKFVICQVPCYTEGEDSLQQAFESLAMLNYDDKRKLIFVIADGMIVGSGNDRPTPRIVLDLLGVDPKYNPDPLPFKSVGEGANQLNYGKVYSGLYEHEGHVVPYLVVVKVGRPTERNRPGNRGKRDSQIILMRFLNRVHFDRAMSPLELEVFHQLKNVIGVHPSFYEYVLMVDADTQVSTQSLNRLISCMLHDQRVMGICGETRLANEDLTWATMIQVYEYYISHHMAKAFESLFGSVTCLPGCFCMYRVRTPVKNRPLIIADDVVDAYSESHVDTLHKKNLLSLGEDRYLTTLMLKHFPQYKMTFTPDATCETAAPEKWSILLSQRRRWINSTIHNLVELLFLQDLCGFCCFSMRFVVMIDLIGTVLMPASLVYIGYLIYMVVDAKNSGTQAGTSFVSLIILVAVYGLQAVIFILKRQWQHIGWMIIYLLAMPIFSFLIPIYSFWHFDDFSWGNTRVVVGENKKKKIITVGEDEKFDPRKIPMRTWAQYEQEMWEVGSNGSRDSRVSGATGYTHNSHHSRAASRAGAESHYGDMGQKRLSNQMETMSQGHRVSYAASVMNGPEANGYSHGSGMPGADYRMSQTYSGPMGGDPIHGGSTPHVMDPRQSAVYNPGYARSEYDPSSGMGPAMDSSGMPRPVSNFGTGNFSMSGGAYGQPSDEKLMGSIRHILATSDLMTITKKQVRDQLSAMYGVDLTPRKDFINNAIEMVLQGRL